MLIVSYTTLNLIITRQILSAVSGSVISIVVGIVAVAIVNWVIAVFGTYLFRYYDPTFT